MAEYLSEAWFDEQREAGAALPSRPGVSGVVQFVVAGGPEGDVTYVTTVADGAITAVTVGPADEPDATLAVPYAEGLAMADGDLDPNAAYMQGRIKTTGATGPLLAVLSVLQDLSGAAGGPGAPGSR